MMTIKPQDKPLKILHLEDSALDHDLVCRRLRATGFDFEMVRVETLDAFTQAMQEATYDAVLADYRLHGFTALDAWHLLKEQKMQVPFVLLSGSIGEATAVAAIHLGISDFVAKQDMSTLARVIQRALETHRVKLAKQKSEEELARSEKRLAQFSEHLQSAIEQERAAIAREIHDDIGGALAAAKLNIAWISRHNGDEATCAHIQSATEMLQHAIDASQRIMLNLRPSILDQGILAAIQWLASSFEKRTRIRTLLRSNNEHISASKDIELAAYRTTQEALTNIAKYANCDLVCIEISDAEKVLTVEITDNGKGISEKELENPIAFGIRGLRERAKLVGGWLDVSTREGQGTSLTLSVPLQEPSQQNSEGNTP